MNKGLKWAIIAFIGIILIIGLAVAGYFLSISKSDEPAVTDAKEKTIKPQRRENRMLNVNAMIIKQQSLTDEISRRGRLVADEEVDLSFETSGKITKINFAEGSTVQKGQLLAKVNDASLQAQLKRLEVQLKLAEDRVFRQNALLEKDAVSKEAYEQVQTDLATLRADIELIKANIALTELHAPFEGVIGLRQVSEGAYASPSTVIAKLTKLSPLKLEFSVPEQYASQIKKGTKVNFNIEGDLNTFNAQVYATESKIETTTNSLIIRALYPNDNGKLLPGQTTSLKIKMHEISDAIAIPSEAIVPEMGQDKVFLYKSGKAYPVTITKGLRTDALVQVLNGLSIGDTLITSGTLQLRMGLDVLLDEIN
ncbi:Toluene efflux pump periplasmic linker protein TtgG [termite gut metagenome]|uniref:Toluene efflux pump periplasmic linker protein TtgG n=1 Tax=termite gut metagenome TaxID=433724 RepID=A0A5J4RXE3_9ZZZZ